MDFNKLTLKSQEAVATAQELGRRLGNPELYPEHLLLALLDQELPQQLVPDAAEICGCCCAPWTSFRETRSSRRSRR
jgi:ATP-dependent Clp protease ATP-binding subunit ClpA